jgi:sulfite reductase (NADPH) hemoprotein beta-component
MGSTVGNGERLQALVRHLMENFDTELMITPNQDLLFTNLDPAAKDDFEAALPGFKYGVRGGKRVSRLRTLSGACVGLPTCRLSYTDSEQFEPELIGQLEAMGYGDFHESIGVTGCERQCFRPATKSIGWVGQGPGMYMLKIGGDEAGRHQGTPLVENDNLYLRQVPRDHVATVTATLFDHWQNHREADEDLGTFHRRLGHAAILAHLRDHPATAKLTEKAAPASYEPTQNTAA